jgi:glycosyltransferase involved in cell wall biosynthesis
MKDKMHILLPIWYPIGGIRTFLRYVYGQFSPEQYKLTILLPETSELDATREDLANTDASFEVLPPNPSALVFMSKIACLLRKQKIDVIHSQGFTSGILAAFPARLHRTPHILTSHDVLRRDQFHGFSGQIKKLLLPFLLSLPDMIHSVSNDAQENLLEFFPQLRNTRKQCVIHNGIDSKRFLVEERADLKSKIGLPATTFLIGFFGRFMPQKGFDILVDAVEILIGQNEVPDFMVVAFGWGGFVREEQEAIEHRRLSKYFSFLPFEPNVAQALRGVDVVAMPSRWEACPLLPMEALVAGVPIIGTDCLGLREVLQGTLGIIVPVGDSKALAMALLNEMEEPSLIKRFESFRQEAARRVDVNRQVEGIKKMLCDVVSGAYYHC